MTTLFGDDKPAKPVKPKSKRTDVIGYNPVAVWVEEYQARWMTKLKMNGMDARACCDAAEGYSEPEFRAMIKCFFDATDHKFLEEGHRVQDLKRCKNRWKQEASQR